MHRKLLLLIVGVVSFPAWAASGTMLKDEELKSTPSASAGRVANVAKGSTVEVLARQGGWTQIRAGGQTGWVRVLSVRAMVSTTGAGDLVALTSRREGSQVVAVAGLRGLNEEELKGAKFNPQELLLLDRYRVDQAEATSFAHAANLMSRKVGYLPDPKSTASDKTHGGSVWGDGL
jgi:uncharacterized protein YraI